MSDENAREVYRALRDSQTRYSYALLAAAGAAIGVALNRTQTASLSLSQAPLGLAVFCWGLSFFFGCRHLTWVSAVLYANADLIQVQLGRHPLVGQHPELMAVAADGIRDALASNNSRAHRYARWQFDLLVAGGLLYLVWHVGEMYLRSRQ